MNFCKYWRNRMHFQRFCWYNLNIKGAGCLILCFHPLFDFNHEFWHFPDIYFIKKTGAVRPLSQLVKKALLQGVPSPEGDGIKLNPVISGGMYLGNNTSCESFADNFTRNRGKAFVQSFSKKWLCPFFDSLDRGREAPVLIQTGYGSFVLIWTVLL